MPTPTYDRLTPREESESSGEDDDQQEEEGGVDFVFIKLCQVYFWLCRKVEETLRLALGPPLYPPKG